MEIETTQFGIIHIEEENIITMPQGMPGFPGCDRFVIFEREETWPFYWYQCVDEPELAFVIIDPFLFKPDYSVNTKLVMEEMLWQDDEKDSIKIYTIVNASNSRPKDITVNLLGPIVINTKRNQAIQWVIHNKPYSHKYPLFFPKKTKNQ
ncbi:MAG: flagellar assembly protein FliW [Desulfobacterales bacterium]|nr:flagellar assembly protein FliW [Desulfobacterales bacterium]